MTSEWEMGRGTPPTTIKSKRAPLVTMMSIGFSPE
jgi:hypothetical protein